MDAKLLELYNTTVKTTLEELEIVRKKVMLWTTLLYISLGGFIISFMTELIHWGIALGVFMPLIILFFSMKSKHQTGYVSRFKKDVVEKVIHLINPEFKYDASKHITKTDYNKSKLFEHRVDRFTGDDLVTGIIEKTGFKFSELHSEYKTESTDKDGKKTTHWHTIFKGLFLHADFNKEIKGSTFVLPDKQSFLKIFGEKRKTSKGELVKLENQEFEDLFKVYGSDQIEARYILTPAIMEGIVNLKKRFRNNNLCLSFRGSRVYCCISFKKDLFEPRVFKTGVNMEDIQFMADLIKLITLIIHELNLNTRIWTKE